MKEHMIYESISTGCLYAISRKEDGYIHLNNVNGEEHRTELLSMFYKHYAPYKIYKSNDTNQTKKI